MAPSVDRSSRARLSLIEQVGAIAILPIRFLVSLPVLSIQIYQFVFREILTRPTVLAAILLHGGLLVLPALELTEPDAEELNAPEEEEEPIEVQSLTDLVAASPEAEAPPPEQPEAPPPEAPPPEQQIITEVPPDLPDEELPPIDDLPPENEFEDPEDNPLDQQPAFDQGNAQSGLVGTGASSGLVDVVSALSFKDADQPFFFLPNSAGEFKATSRPIDAVLTMYYFDTAVYGRNAGFAEAQTLAANSGYFLQNAPEGSYGNNSLYTVVDTDGNVVSYMSLVLPVDEDSSVLVLWKSPPV